LHFLLGYKKGDRTHARAASYLVGSDYNPEDAKASVRADWAILVLAEDTETTPLRLSQSPSVAGERIMVGGFSQKYPFKMTADTECRVRGVMTNGLILHDCAVMHGISGAPVMKAITEIDVQIVGVHAASGEVMGSPMAFAVPVSSFAEQASPPRP
jgi:V8-like Glu-specific endopeptidase